MARQINQLGPRTTMKFFADTAEIAEIRELAEIGLLDGVTTNPSLVHKSGRDFIEVLKEIVEGLPGAGFGRGRRRSIMRP